MKGIFAYDGPVIEFLTKTGEMLLLNFITLLLCIPIITIGPALTSYYYATVKCVVHDRGNLLQEYWKSFKRVFLRGMLITIVMVIWFVVLYYGRLTAIANATEKFNLLEFAYEVIMVLSAALGIYIFPVLSRFEMKLLKLVKLAFVMSIRYFYLTILFLAAVIGCAYLIIFKLPILWILIIPALLVFGGSFLMEKPLLKYMPPLPEDRDDWYHEKPWKKKENTED